MFIIKLFLQPFQSSKIWILPQHKKQVVPFGILFHTLLLINDKRLHNLERRVFVGEGGYGVKQYISVRFSSYLKTNRNSKKL